MSLRVDWAVLMGSKGRAASEGHFALKLPFGSLLLVEHEWVMKWLFVSDVDGWE
jgi:hypothetical protein